MLLQSRSVIVGHAETQLGWSQTVELKLLIFKLSFKNKISQQHLFVAACKHNIQIGPLLRAQRNP